MRFVQRLVSTARIKHLSGLTLKWLAEHAENFRIPPGGTESVLSRVKPFTELMLLLVVLAKYGSRNQRIAALTDLAFAQCNEFDWHYFFSYDASGATIAATVAELFASKRLPPPFELEYLRFLHGSGFLESMDRVPYREMDLAYCLTSVISPDFQNELPAWFSGTSFGRRLHWTRYTVDDLYALTHAAFYLSNFGTRDLEPLLDAPTAERLRRELAGLTAVVLRTDNVDVLAELLLCWLFCRVHDSRINRIVFRQAFERLMSATTDAGPVVPGLRVLPRAKAGEATFEDLYHTTLVAALLFAIAAKDLPLYVC